MLKPGHPNKMCILKEKEGPIHWTMTGRNGTLGKVIASNLKSMTFELSHHQILRLLFPQM